jgi:hypothetical protein
VKEFNNVPGILIGKGGADKGAQRFKNRIGGGGHPQVFEPFYAF